MVSGISNIEQSIFQPMLSQSQAGLKTSFEPINSFADEDQAIISSEAQLLNQLEKFNSGGDNAVDLAVQNVMTEYTVSAQVNVINTKKDMIDNLLQIGE